MDEKIQEFEERIKRLEDIILDILARSKKDRDLEERIIELEEKLTSHTVEDLLAELQKIERRLDQISEKLEI
ncbi:MAG: hypothetical protein ACE5K4_02665 [Candidatus Hydrothermarchaeota archaeon]